MTSPTIRPSLPTVGRAAVRRRVGALGIDAATVLLVLLVLRRLLGPGMVSFAVVALFAIAVFGVVQGETGTSPGKALLDLKLIDERGRPPGTAVALIRLAAWVVDGLPCLGALGLLLIWSSPTHQRVGDLITRTIVVSTRPEPVESAPAAEPGPTPEHYDGGDPAQPQHFDPIWDPRLEAYVQWDPVDKRWMKYDDVLGGWGPVEVG